MVLTLLRRYAPTPKRLLHANDLNGDIFRLQARHRAQSLVVGVTSSDITSGKGIALTQVSPSFLQSSSLRRASLTNTGGLSNRLSTPTIAAGEL